MKGLIKEIIDSKKKEVEEKKKKKSLSEMIKEAKPAERDFRAALESKRRPINLIAELKKVSPFEGVLRENFDIKQIVPIYEKHAQAISVITDEKYFQGNIGLIKEAKAISKLPVLRKDFVVDEYQIYESAASGADAVLLISSIVSRQHLQKFVKICKEIGLPALVEVHNSEDFERAFSHDVRIIGINNRDLETMKVDLNSFSRIRPFVPEDILLVAESGYNSKPLIDALKGKADAVLIGSVLMKAPDIEQKLLELGF